jgi:hypothetical protein
LREAVARWAATAQTDEAGMRPPRRLPQDAAYRRVREFLQQRIDRRIFAGSGDNPL